MLFNFDVGYIHDIDLEVESAVHIGYVSYKYSLPAVEVPS